MVGKLKGDSFWNYYLESEKHCSNNCNTCPMYLVEKKRCLHKSIDSWQKWNDEKRKNRVWKGKHE